MESFKAEAVRINNIYKAENICIEAHMLYDMEMHSNELENVKKQIVR